MSIRKVRKIEFFDIGISEKRTAMDDIRISAQKTGMRFYEVGTNLSKVCRPQADRENGENEMFSPHTLLQFSSVSRRSCRFASRSADSTAMPSIFSSLKVPSAGIRWLVICAPESFGIISIASKTSLP